MSNLIVNQKCILDLFSDKKTTFLIPDYQRPYAWGETECQTLWDDLFNFTFPDNDVSKSIAATPKAVNSAVNAARQYANSLVAA